MAILTEGLRNNEFIIETLPGTMSYAEMSVDNANADMPPGTPLMVVGADLVVADAVTAVATAINVNFLPAAAAAVNAAVLYRDAEVNNNDLNWGALGAPAQATIRGELATVGIRVRTA